MPDHADPAIGADGADGASDGLGHREVLMWLRDPLGESTVVLVEGDEVVEELAEALEVEQSVQRPVDLGLVLAVRAVLAHGDGASVVIHIPGGEVVPGRERCAVAGVDPVGRDHERGEAERHGQFRDVGLQLVERGLGGRGSGAGLLEFHDRQWQSVHVRDDVEASLHLPAAHGHLVDDAVAVQRRVTGVEADHGGAFATVVVDVGDAAVPVSEDLVEAVVLRDRVLRLRGQYLRRGLLQVLPRHVGVQVLQCLVERAAQHDVLPRLALPRARRDLRAGRVLPVELAHPIDDELLPGVLSGVGRHVRRPPRRSSPRP